VLRAIEVSGFLTMFIVAAAAVNEETVGLAAEIEQRDKGPINACTGKC
jgi:hypothetical protein